MSTISKKIFEKSFRSFIQNVHPDKFAAQSRNAFVRNTKLMQVMNMLNDEIICILGNIPSKCSPDDLMQNIRSLLPPFSWVIYSSTSTDGSVDPTISDISLPTTVTEEIRLKTDLENRALLCHNPSKLNFLLFICRNVFLPSRVDPSFLATFAPISVRESTPICAEHAIKNVKFSAIFHDACTQEDHDISQTLLGKLSTSPNHAWMLFKPTDSTNRIRDFSAIPYENTSCTRESLRNHHLLSLKKYKRPRSSFEYKMYCDAAVRDIDAFLGQT